MPAGRFLACEPYGPRGIIGSQGAVVFLERGAVGGAKHGRCPVFFAAESDHSGNVPSYVPSY